VIIFFNLGEIISRLLSNKLISRFNEKIVGGYFSLVASIILASSIIIFDIYLIAFCAFIFGFGMQLANGCGSGVLFTFGSGSTRMMVALPFFIIGSVIGTFILPFVIDIMSLGQIIIAGNATATQKTLVNFICI